jgi:hypothetical protein
VFHGLCAAILARWNVHGSSSRSRGERIKRSGHFLIIMVGPIWWRQFLSSLCIPSSVERLSTECFAECSSLSAVSFETASQLSWMECGVFLDCLSLSAICVPSALKRLPRHSFAGCRSPATVTFETGSRLSHTEDETFRYCPSMSSICLPPAARPLCQHCCSECQALSAVTFESCQSIPDSASCVLVRRCE